MPHSSVRCIFQDSRGYLWIGTGDGLGRFDGYRFTTYETSDGLGHMIVEIHGQRIITYGPGQEFGVSITCFAEDGKGRLMAVNEAGILEFTDPPNPISRGSWKAAPLHFSDWAPLHHLTVDHEGAVWVAAEHGLIKYKNGHHTVYTTSNGLSNNNVQFLAQDRDRNLWIGTYSGGVCMPSAEPAVGLGRSDGLTDDAVVRKG